MLMGGIFAGLPCRGHCKCRRAELNILLYVLVEDYVVTKHASVYQTIWFHDIILLLLKHCF